MPEQPQWSERTLDMPPQDPWAEAPTATPVTGPRPAAGPPPTTPFAAPQPPPAAPFNQGRAQVNARPQAQRPPFAEHEPTGTGWPGAEPPAAHPAMSWRWSELRRGGEWTSAAVLFAFVCWGIWALSGDGPFGTPMIVLAVTLAVAAGLFCLARFVGHLVLERQLGRVRHSARGSHLVTALFLAGVGIAHLQQTEWVMNAYHWVADHL